MHKTISVLPIELKEIEDSGEPSSREDGSQTNKETIKSNLTLSDEEFNRNKIYNFDFHLRDNEEHMLQQQGSPTKSVHTHQDGWIKKTIHNSFLHPRRIYSAASLAPTLLVKTNEIEKDQDTKGLNYLKKHSSPNFMARFPNIKNDKEKEGFKDKIFSFGKSQKVDLEIQTRGEERNDSNGTGTINAQKNVQNKQGKIKSILRILTLNKNSTDIVRSTLSLKQLELLNDFDIYKKKNYHVFIRGLNNVRIPNSLRPSLASERWNPRLFQLEKERRSWWAWFKQPILPHSKFRSTWDVWVMLIVLIDMIILPLQISFGILYNFDEFAYLCNAVFSVDILCNFHTAYYHFGILITSHREIAKKYIKTWFLIDLVAAFPFYIFNTTDPSSSSSQQAFQFFRLIKFLRIFRLFKLRNLIGKITALSSSQTKGWWELTKLFFLTIMFAHWLACGWHYLALLEIDVLGENAWLIVNNLEWASPYYKYLTSIYWAITTMLTVGYGDITPVSAPELVFASFTMLIGCGLFAYTINKIGSIINEIGEQRVKLK